MGPANSLSYLIQHLSAVITRQSDQVLQEQLGIGISQFKILMVLEWNPRIQQRAVATSLGESEAAVSRQIKLLKTKGLLLSKIDPANRRKHITVPTPLGMQVTEAATDLLRRSFSSDFAGVGEDQILKLASGLQQLHRVVCQPGKLGACDHQLGF